jgi:hypothetical protein
VVLWDQGNGGTTFTPIVGDSTPNLLASIIINTGISSGETYRFKIKGRNTHGDGAESDAGSILAATVPSPMNPPVVSAVSAHSSLQYRISISAPHSGGQAVGITAYEIEFKEADGDFSAVSECDGSSATFLANEYCDVDLASLTSPPFSL